jgi:hypothetical protein
MECRGSELRFFENFTIIKKFLNDRAPSSPLNEISNRKYGNMEQAQVAMDSRLITILALRPFK